MKAGIFFSALLLFFAITSCSDDKKEKKAEQPAKDSAAVVEKTTPLIETEFADTVVTTPAKDSVLLKFNFQKGKRYNYTMSFDVAQSKEDQKRSTSMKWNYDMEVTEVKKDLKTIKTTYKKIEMVMDMGGEQKMEFSSEKEVDATDFMQMPSKMFSIIKGKSFTMQITDRGEIISVSGFDKIGDAVIAEMNLPAEMRPMIQQNFKKQFSDKNAKEMFSQWFGVYPNKYVKTGDTWKNKTKITGLEQEASTRYTVKNIKDGRVFISGVSEVVDGKGKSVVNSKFIMEDRTGLMLDGMFEQKSGGDEKTTTKSRITGRKL